MSTLGLLVARTGITNRWRSTNLHGKIQSSGSVRARDDAMLVLSYNATKKTTFAVMYGYDEGNLTSMINILHRMKKHTQQPLLLLFIFTEHILQDAEIFLRTLWDDFKVVHRSLDCGDYFAHQPLQSRNFDVTDMPHKLTCLANATADVASRNVAITQKVEFIRNLAYRMPGSSSNSFMLDMRNQISLMHQRCESLKSQNDYMKESLQSTMQMVYATLQQRDNQINQYYAANVNIISAITIIFLRGTFVATLFSSSFWNFDPRSTGPIVSHWVWLYFTVTFVLTLIVLSMWRGYLMFDTVLKIARRDGRGEAEGGGVKRGRRSGDEEAAKKGT
ncbi:hypothetical protein EK21DRAFT_92246 [Setomelanomma holmii]|uniref:Uncharacterized protein n=1 Tax=Setomelanomma holmii TaxID=210430 RepID=A0A9P4LII4_9PLEO|nr:hypothetical protein EK21DRAFT_92246 [Setomelanomma holmii]